MQPRWNYEMRMPESCALEGDITRVCFSAP